MVRRTESDAAAPRLHLIYQRVALGRTSRANKPDLHSVDVRLDGGPEILRVVHDAGQNKLSTSTARNLNRLTRAFVGMDAAEEQQ